MAKLPLYAAGITATFTTLLITAAAEDAALLKQAQGIFQPLPKDMATAEFPITRERVELGRSLFFDPRLTIDANMSCSSCHQPGFYGTDALPKPTGVKQRPHPRHVPTNLNAGTSFVIHWRGDRTNLEQEGRYGGVDRSGIACRKAREGARARSLSPRCGADTELVQHWLRLDLLPRRIQNGCAPGAASPDYALRSGAKLARKAVISGSKPLRQAPGRTGGYRKINLLPLTPALAKVGVGGSNPLARSSLINDLGGAAARTVRL